MDKISHKGSVFVIIVCIIAGVYVPSTIGSVKADPITFYVDDDADPSWYDGTHVRTIQEGINSASWGDTVFVYSGTYVENVVMKDQVNLIGESADNTIIQGIVPTADVVTAEDVHSAVLRGLHITTTSPSMGSGRGINIQASSLLVERNVVRDIGIGINVQSYSTAVIQNNVLYPDFQMYGIYIERSSPTVKNNIIMNYDIGVYAFGASYPTLGYNDVYDCISPYSGISPGIGSISEDPRFVAPAFDYFHLQGDSPCINTGDPLDSIPPGGGSRVDMGAFEYLQKGTPPSITFGPEVNVLSGTSVEVQWTTDKSCNSTVVYGQNSGMFTDTMLDSVFNIYHDVELTGLQPSSTYRYEVLSYDLMGNRVCSQINFFTTNPSMDIIPPNIEVEEPPIVTGPTPITVNVTDNIGVEKTELFVDDECAYTVFGDSFGWLFDPSALPNGEHEFSVQAYDQAGGITQQDIPLWVDIAPIDDSSPYGGIISPLFGETVSGSEVVIEAWGIDSESGIEKIVFYVNDELLHVDYINGLAIGDEHSTYYWNSFGTPNGDDVEIKVEIYNKVNLSTAVTTTVTVENTVTLLEQIGDPYYAFKIFELTRGQTKREGVYYETKLYVQNVGPQLLTDVVVKDVHYGFQAIQSDYGYQPRVRFNPDTKSSIVTFSIGNLMPGEIKELIIYLTPVLFTPVPVDIDYRIGKETFISCNRVINPGVFKSVELYFQVPVVKTIDGWWGTNEIPLTKANILGPIHDCDYLIVTHPRNLYNTYSDPDVDALLSGLARFVRHKGGVLGYLDSYDPKNELKYITRFESGFKWNLNGLIFYMYKGWWNSLLRSDWSSNGYMLIVGETEIVPSFDLHVVVSTGEYDVPLSDNPYADLNDDNLPDIAIGRIIGNDAKKLLLPIETSLGVFYDNPGYHFDSSHALLISGTGKYNTSFVNNINTLATKMSWYMAPFKIHMTQVTPGYYKSTFQYFAPYKDIIHFNGHGGAGGLSPFLDENDFPIDFHDTNPILLAFACSCGLYKPDSDVGVAETALANDVGVFIGSTRMSNTGTNANVGVAFYENYYRPWIPIGQSFKDLKRYLWSISETYYRWVLEYNIYGDPKYEQQTAKENNEKDSDRLISTPQESLVIDFPMYTVTRVEDVDYIEIPGEKILANPGQPMVPYATRQLEIPPGYQVQEVILTERSNLTYNTSINCLTAPDDYLEQCTGEPPIILNHTWYPDDDYEWSVISNVSGNDNLVIVMYPFFYNNDTKDVHYFKHFEFSIVSTRSVVEITQLRINKSIFNPGETLFGMVELINTGSDNKSVLLKAIVESYVGDHYTDGLPLRILELRLGRSAVLFSWNTSDIPSGDYKLHLRLENLSEELYDIKTLRFTLGNTTGAVTSFTATPELFNISDSINITMVFENTGTTNLNGSAHITIKSSSGETIEMYNQSFTGLTPSNSMLFHTIWNTDSLIPDIYTVHGYVLYGSSSAVAQSITLYEYTVYDVQTKTYMSVIPSYNMVSVGDTFDLDVYLDPTEEISQWEINMSFTPGVLNVTGVDSGPPWGTFFDPGVIDNESGTITFVQSQIPFPFIDEENVACTLHLKANKTGLALVGINHANVSNSSLQTIDIYLNDAYIEIVPNISPIISKTYPENGSLGTEESGSIAYRPPVELNTTVENPNGNQMDVYLMWKQHDYYHEGEWITLTSYLGINNGTYNYIPSGNNWIWGNTSYTWSVNITDGTYWTNKTFTFTTGGSRYDVNNDGKVNFIDAGIVWVHRTTNAVYDGLYDVNQDGDVNFIDAGKTWVNRD
jgi:parallel beta-helix repeat protein